MSKCGCGQRGMKNSTVLQKTLLNSTHQLTNCTVLLMPSPALLHVDIGDTIRIKSMDAVAQMKSKPVPATSCLL